MRDSDGCRPGWPSAGEEEQHSRLHSGRQASESTAIRADYNVRLVQCKRFLVAGRVQGVFYRASAARRARELGIAGHARNLPDGRVEVLACGTGDGLREFEAWLWIGSSASKVTAVEVSEVAPPAQRPAGFSTG
jgi:acylphosphatase